MKVFTPRTRLYRVRHCKQFKTFKKYILAPRRVAVVMQPYSIKRLTWMFPLNVSDTVDTLNIMRARAEAGSIFYSPLARKDTGVYGFIIGKNAPFVLIMPGGGYGDVCSLIEGYSVALKFNALGYNAFIVNYTVGKIARYTYPADDVAESLRFILSNREKWKVGENYAVCGFSAGGHLAACWGTDALGYKNYGLTKPQVVILAYPVITMGEYTHKGSRKNLLGKYCAAAALRERYSVERQIAPSYPPTFIWQCKNDNVVPFENSLAMARALQNNGVPYEFMPVEGCAHGWGLAKGTAADGWLEKAVRFWKTAESGCIQRKTL